MSTKAPKKAKPVQTKLDQAVALQQSGDVSAAKTIFLQALKADVKNPVALYSLAAIECGHSNFNQALTYIEPVLLSHPQFPQAHLAHSVILFNLNEMAGALTSVLKAIELDPTLPTAQSHLQTVQTVMESANTTKPQGSAEALGLNTQGIALQSEGKHGEALALFEQALAYSPNNFMSLYSMGVSQSALGLTLQAKECFEQAITAAPHMAIGYFAKAKTLHDLGLAEAAIAAYDEAIQADPNYMEAYTNKAALLQAINRHHDGLLTLVAATDIDPNHVRSLEGQGLILGQYKQYGMAIQAFQRALQADPDYIFGEGHLISARMSNCDWTDFEAKRELIFEGIRAGKKMCGPLTIMSLTDDAELARQCIEIYAADKYGPSMFTLWNGEKYQHRRKRVAFISADFRTHPVGYLMIGMLEKFDKSKFEITGVFTGTPDASDLWKRYRCAFDHYLDVQDKPSLEVAKLLRAMEIDIVIDLSGHTEGTRLEILSHRPAPVQMTYLGFPGTLGLPFIDYLITDPVTVPPDMQQHYREKILYLPHCYLPRDDSVVPADKVPTKAECGLPEEGVVFCSFNHDYKINPPMFKVWMDLLKAVPGSVLWLMKLNDGAHANLTQSAIDQGVDPNRLVYATRVPSIEDHLARYKLADVCLDTFPYNGHTTTSDALLAGVPVVTLMGSSFASRVAASLLHDVGLPELACYSYQEYQNKALQMATDAAIRTHYKGQLKQCMDSQSWPPTPKQQSVALNQLLQQI
ncbi:tetratricopeptide repeat protein [Limnohabitans sp.]|uniref:tetratricopeptide repeat protein n=1 Tax=Limnohabitans sp. TaxID=1907725 RepID=UPI00286F624A|nr:tetratricopeptide repeat protein [Limnohabitans sp.]